MGPWVNLNRVMALSKTPSRTPAAKASPRLKDTLRVVSIPLSSCRANPDQPRKVFNPSALKELANSIAEHGLLQPITIKPDPQHQADFLIVAGERRFRAFELLGKATIPAIITSGKVDEIALIENLQRETLTPIEEAEAMLKLKEKYNYTQEELAKSIGKARSTVTNLLKLNNLPKSIRQECLMSNIATRSFLIELARVNNPKQQLKMWREAKERGVTVRQVRIKKQSEGAQRLSDSKRVLSAGKRFVSELERLADTKTPLTKERYDELLEVFKRFVGFMDKNASQLTPQD
jgi:ParB family transcriptional regulator, chromosome partitioning protein